MRTVSRKTVAGYVSAAAHQMGKAMTAAANCDEITDKEAAEIFKAKRLLRSLATNTVVDDK